MALNVIKVSTDKGPIWIGVSQIIAIAPGDENKGSTLMIAGFPAALTVLESAPAVAELANRRPPDGN